jgi:hypothetical protein
MSKSIKRSGEIWLSMAKDLLVERGRKMKVLNAEYEASQVELGKPRLDQETGEIKYDNDLKEASYDIAVSVGPSSSSKRAATVRALTGMMQMTQDPETLTILSSMAMMNMEGEGLTDIRKFYREKLVKMGVIMPSEEEARQLLEEAENMEPDANTLYLQSAAQNEMAKAEKAKADTLLQIARAEETKADTMKTLSEVQSQGQDRMIKAAEQVRQTAEVLSGPAPDVTQMSNDQLISLARGA